MPPLLSRFAASRPCPAPLIYVTVIILSTLVKILEDVCGIRAQQRSGAADAPRGLGKLNRNTQHLDRSRNRMFNDRGHIAGGGLLVVDGLLEVSHHGGGYAVLRQDLYPELGGVRAKQGFEQGLENCAVPHTLCV